MTDAIDKLQRLLVAERQALAAGDLDAMADLLRRKETALAGLPQTGLSPHRLTELKAEAERVQGLLAASLEGIAAARTRIGVLQQVRAGLTTYDSRGQKANPRSIPTSGIERKV